jgi:tetratricopeptide (TPR) repeat protein
MNRQRAVAAPKPPIAAVSRRYTMRSKLILWLAAFALALAPAFAAAQDAATGQIHGHVQDPANTAIANAQVILSNDGKTPLYTFNTDQNGDYKGGGIKPGTYYITLFETAKAIDRFENVKFTAGTDTLQDFDLSRADYVSKLSPEQRKALEEAKKKNAEVNQANQSISKLNDQLKQARADNAAKKYDDAAGLMQQAVVTKPDAAVLWMELGIAQTGQKKYDDAAVSLKKSLDLDIASKKVSPEIEATANSTLGEVYASTNKIPDAAAAYDAAAKLQPANAAMFYSNESIVLDRAGQTDATIAAADKAIAADPTKPVPYYLKGKALISKATVDPKTQKVVAPPGTADAYNKYLELAPNGPMAPDAKAILAEIGEKVNTKYSAGKH